MSAVPEPEGAPGIAYTNGRYTGYQGVQEVSARIEW